MLGGSGLEFFENLIQKGCKQPRFALMPGGFSDADLACASRLRCAVFVKPFEMAKMIAWLEAVERSVGSERSLLDWNHLGRTDEQAWVRRRESNSP